LPHFLLVDDGQQRVDRGRRANLGRHLEARLPFFAPQRKTKVFAGLPHQLLADQRVASDAGEVEGREAGVVVEGGEVERGVVDLQYLTDGCMISAKAGTEQIYF
jgi:hypothetical protein